MKLDIECNHGGLSIFINIHNIFDCQPRMQDDLVIRQLKWIAISSARIHSLFLPYHSLVIVFGQANVFGQQGSTIFNAIFKILLRG